MPHFAFENCINRDDGTAMRRAKDTTTAALYGVSKSTLVLLSYPVPLSTYIVLLLVCLHPLWPPRVYLLLLPFIWESWENSKRERHRFVAAIKAALTRRGITRLPCVPLYKLTSIIIIPLVRRSGSLRISLAFSTICLDPFTWFSVSRPLAACSACTIARLRNPLPQLTTFECRALPMYLVTCTRDPRVSLSAFILRLAAIFFHAILGSHYLRNCRSLNR